MRGRIIVIMVLALMLTACGSDDGLGKVKDDRLTVLMPYLEYDYSSPIRGNIVFETHKWLMEAFLIHHEDYKGKVEMILLEAVSEDDYTEQVTRLMISDSPPDLILQYEVKTPTISVFSLGEDLEKAGGVQAISYDRLDHQMNENLKEGAYLPFSIIADLSYVDKVKVKELFGSDKVGKLSAEEVELYLDAWLESKTPILNSETYSAISHDFFPNRLFINRDKKSYEFVIEDILTRANRLKKMYANEQFAAVDAQLHSVEDIKAKILSAVDRFDNDVKKVLDEGGWLPYYPVGQVPYVYLEGYAPDELYRDKPIMIMDAVDEYRTTGYYINNRSDDLDLVYEYLNYVYNYASTTDHYFSEIKKAKMPTLIKNLIVDFIDGIESGEILAVGKDIEQYDEFRSRFSESLLNYIIDDKMLEADFVQAMRDIEYELNFKLTE
ncbi:MULTISPECIES: hypothetical protein [unclassified Fusibacter]|uniref:hypothetical protein n=1 Tax=unclassified Fusibacter TaxID=2624464 RepID=UPI0010134689|nr:MULTISPECIES: hypothetical protein [unclassified Fusibacter]MCK8061161.1 hypothetical protein [Fusibacter sp. A2]NPE23302.1 hypothetical protein [Fusibacter sp. A1]RXV59344.1 hypothetical protein DWB64_15890 [Fusibacter sp. A1]